MQPKPEMPDNPTIIDVRDEAKYRQRHIKGALHLNHERIAAGQGPDLPKDASIVTYCGSGNKAGRMAEELRRQGFTNVVSTSLPSLEKRGLAAEGEAG